MYNLIVTAAANGWDGESFVLPLSRYLEYTDEKIAGRFKSLDEAAQEQLRKLPTLFAYEAPIKRDARVGWIRRIQQRDDDIRLHFKFDDEVVPVSPDRIETLAWDLDIVGAYEMNRTHWAIKDVDLLRALAGSTGVEEDVPPYRTSDLAGAVVPSVANSDNSHATPSGNTSPLNEYLPEVLRERFEVVLHLGSGSFAAVYQVVDKQSQQRFALKVLNNTPDARQRAPREVDASKLTHPNILSVIEHHPAGQWFLFPLAEGTLGQLRSWGRLSSESSRDVALSVGAALAHAHAASFLHRDLHPENILRHDGRWTVTDWGLAVARDHQRLTRTRSVGGTETWTAPEQLRSLKDADERSDLFSLGRLVEWLASGKVPDPNKAGQLPNEHPLASFVSAVTALSRDARPSTVNKALQLIPGDGASRMPTQIAPLQHRPPNSVAANSDVQLSVTFQKKHITQDHHDYELVVSLKNLSNRRWEDWELEFEFPTPLMGGTIYGIKVADRSNADVSFFRIEGRRLQKPLRPGDEQVARIQYFVNRTIYYGRRNLFDATASARALLDGTIAAEVVRPIRELQDF